MKAKVLAEMDGLAPGSRWRVGVSDREILARVGLGLLRDEHGVARPAPASGAEGAPAPLVLSAGEERRAA